MTHFDGSAYRLSWRVLATGVLATAVAGCGMSSLTSGIGGGMFGGGQQKTEMRGVNEEQLLTAAKADEAGATGSTNVGEIAHGCPRIVISGRDNNVTIYEQGRIGDGLAIMHRGEITKSARECQVEPGRVTVKYGFSGRVLLGPRGRDGNVSLPITVQVKDGKRERVATDQLRVDVSVALDKPIGYFSAVRSLTFAIPEGSRPGEYEVFVAFDRNVPGAG
jgi:hypothetical protein